MALEYNSELWFDSSNWTIECWVHPNTFANYGAIWEHGLMEHCKIYCNLHKSNRGLALLHNLQMGQQTMILLYDIFKYGHWHHIAVVRNGSTVTAYLNGIAGRFAYDLYNSTTRSHFIGTQGDYDSTVMYNGFISNFRIVKGTALYTDDFIPPTRELKKVPGTVLLCCQDEDSVTTEATGKTITGYGDLQKADGVELVTNGHFNTDVTGWLC